MKRKIRILFVASEINPFLKLSSASDFIRLLPQKLQDKGYDIRIFMPKFGVINERRNRLHEVVRLSGINIRVAGEEKPLTIKVASIPNAKLQVYFLDNEDYFKRKAVLTDKKTNVFFKDNDERAIFFCKGVIETVKKLGWPPDVIHCHDWMSAFVPLYLRSQYKEDPTFKNSKIVYSLYNNGFEESFAKNYSDKVSVDGVNGDALQMYESNDYLGLCKGAISLADVVTKGSEQIAPELEAYLQENNIDGEYYDPSDKKGVVQHYHELYSNAIAQTVAT